jgi:hypothetical protein
MTVELPDYAEANIENQKYYKAYLMKFYNDRITQNLLNVKNSPAVKKYTFINPNLYEIAAKFYQDADQWILIAKANGFDTPFLSGTYLLSIPSVVPPSTGGILNV